MDLNKLFGKRYVVTLDPSWDAEAQEIRTESRPEDVLWHYHEIKGRRGLVYPYSETQIAVVLPTRAARRLVRFMGSELILLQHADDEMCYKADVKHAGALIRFIKPKSRRRLTEIHRAALAVRLAANRYQRHKPANMEPGWVGSGAQAPGTLVPQGAYPANPPPHQNDEIRRPL